MIWSHRSRAVVALAALCLAVGCSVEPAEASAGGGAPAVVAAPEEGVSTVTLTPDAERRLGIRTAAARVSSLRETVASAAELTVPPGGSLSVTSPFAARVRAAGDALPPAGRHVSAGETVLELLPLVALEEGALGMTAAERLLAQQLEMDLSRARIAAARAVATAAVRLEAAELALSRAASLLEADAGSARIRDEALAERDRARVEHEAALGERDLLESLSVGAPDDADEVFAAVAPLDGVLVDVRVGEGQVIGPGASLFRIERHDPLWVRVPVHAATLPRLDGSLAATLAPLRSGEAPDAAAPGREVLPVDGPPAADPARATVDLWYALPNPDGAWVPGQRVTVRVPTQAVADALVVPWSAVVFDAQGGTWVYARVADLTYRRTRVDLRRVTDGLAEIQPGLDVGTLVVTEGAPELFGAEFGIGS